MNNEELLETIKRLEDELKSHGYSNHFHSRIPLEGHWQPWYDDRKDYNTNAPSYYDYLARFNYFLREITDFINRLARRNINVKDTSTVDLTKTGDWTSQDIIEIKADVKVSTNTNQSYPNAIKVLTDGLYVSDFTNEITKLKEKDTDLQNQITKLKEKDTDLQNEITKLKEKDTDLQNQITNIKTSISNINKMIESLKFMSSGQPPYKTVISTMTVPAIVKNSNPYNTTLQGVGLKVASVSYETDTKTNITTWLQLNLGEITFNNLTKNTVIGSIPISSLKAIGLTQSMIDGIAKFTRVVSGVTVDQRPLEFLLSKTNETIIITYISGFMQGTEGISGIPRTENSTPWIEIVETNK
jgi:FtsZ-binding cell division protein ZapB